VSCGAKSFRACRVEVEPSAGALLKCPLECLPGGEVNDGSRLGGEAGVGSASPLELGGNAAAGEAAEVREALAAAEREAPTSACSLRLCATTGLRAGEVCALRWCGLDLEAGELAVSGNVVHVSRLERAMSARGRGVNTGCGWSRSTRRR
jgi:hypothetical protein